MEPYKDLGNNSGVAAYQLGPESIVVQFKSGNWTIYTYTYESAGSNAVKTMKSLAEQGSGLNSYISTNKPGYVERR